MFVTLTHATGASLSLGATLAVWHHPWDEAYGFAPALALQQPPTVAEGRGVAWLQLYGGAIPCESCLRVPQLVVRPRPVVLRPAVARVHGNGAAVILNRLLRPTLSNRIRRISGDREIIKMHSTEAP